MITRRTLLGAGAAGVGLSVTGAGRLLAQSAPWDSLREHLHGDLVLPGDPGYATAKQLDLMQYDAISPKAVAYCADPADVALCLKFAQDHDLHLAPRSGGHSLGGYSTTPGLVIDVSRLNSVIAGDGTVRIGPGAQNVDVIDALAPSGKAVVGGGCPTVAAGGFIQGGGIGFLTRPLGMACDKVTSAQVVLADGRLVTASPREHCDLFWALRGGGGGNFGMVTSYSVTPAPIAQVATANLAFGYDKALDVVDGYARWLVDAPRTIGGVAFLTLADAAPGNVPVCLVLLVSVGTPEELDDEIGRLTSLTGAPASRTGGVVPYQRMMMGVFQCAEFTVQQCHREGSTPDGRLPRLAYGLERSRMFREPMSRSQWGQALAVLEAERVPGQGRQLQVLPLAGAVNDVPRTASAYVHRDSLCTVNYLAMVRQAPAGDEARAAAHRYVDRGFAAIDPYSSGETYQNFIDPALRDWKSSYYAENYPRLSSVKARYDPYGVFRFAQSI